MGFSSRSVSMMRYRVKGEIEGSFWDTIDNGLRKNSFRPRKESGDEVGMGWVSIDDFTDTEFAGASYVRGNYIALSLRIDTVRVSSRTMEMELKTETKRVLETTGRQRLSSAQRRELKETIKEKLKAKMVPTIQVFDLVWNTAEKTVLFCNLSVKGRERIKDHFKKSFGLTLIPLIPYLRAEELLESATDRQALEKLTPCFMVP